ncbi:cAMP-specific 3',5'-cyclic phosphodiesterase 4D, partial [Reticulomyxa filosa]
FIPFFFFFFFKKKKNIPKLCFNDISLVTKLQKRRANGNVLAKLQKVEEWDFDVFDMAQLCGNYTMAVVFGAIVEKKGLSQQYGLNVENIGNFFMQIAQEYKNNPYHNHVHGIDVLINTNYFLKCNIFEGLNGLDVLACLVSAACHDVGHPGNNNPFEINLESPLAICYNDVSVLENMHAAKTWEVLKRPGCNILEGRSLVERRRFRFILIEAILATDMSKHKRQQDMLTELIDALNEAGVELEMWGLTDSDNDNDNDNDNDGDDNDDDQDHPNDPDDRSKNLQQNKYASSPPSQAGQQQQPPREPSVFDNKQELAAVLIPLAVHTADLSNPSKPLRLYKKWADCVMKEFWMQGDKEKECGLPVTQVCDRTKTDLPTCQTGFINHVIKPWFEIWARLLPEKFAGPLFLKNVN